MVTLAAYGAASTFLLSWALLNAFRLRANFFSAAVYLSKSNACLLIMWNFGIYCTIIFGKLMQNAFFGSLRMIEVERLNERAWFAVTETLLALTIFREEFDTSFVALFISLLFVKTFHWLASDRVEMMEQTQQVSPVFHVRMICCLTALYLTDIFLLLFAAESILLEGPSVMIMFASEYLILLTTVWSTTCKYALNVYDSRQENWEHKSMYVFYVDLVADFAKLVIYLGFFSLILTFYGLPLNTLRDLYMTARSFILKCRDLLRYRAATKNMDERYPNATREEMERLSDKTCIICREDMEAQERPAEGVAAAPAQPGQAAPAAVPAPAAGRTGPNETAKKLPCGHIFHFHCLRSWLERQQSCPTCRRSVLEAEPARPGATPARAPNQPPADANAGPAEPQPHRIRIDAGGNVFNFVPRPQPIARPAAPVMPRPTPTASLDATTASRQVPQLGAPPTNPLVKFKMPTPGSSSSLTFAPWTPSPGFVDALRAQSGNESVASKLKDTKEALEKLKKASEDLAKTIGTPASKPAEEEEAKKEPEGAASWVMTEQPGAGAAPRAIGEGPEEAEARRSKMAEAAAKRAGTRAASPPLIPLNFDLPPRAEPARMRPPSRSDEVTFPRPSSRPSECPPAPRQAFMGIRPTSKEKEKQKSPEVKMDQDLARVETETAPRMPQIPRQDVPRLIPLFPVADPSSTSQVGPHSNSNDSSTAALRIAKDNLLACRRSVDTALQQLATYLEPTGDRTFDEMQDLVARGKEAWAQDDMDTFERYKQQLLSGRKD